MTSTVRCTLAALLPFVAAACRHAPAPGAEPSVAARASACPSGQPTLVVDNRTTDQVEIVTWHYGATAVFGVVGPGRTELTLLGPERQFAARARDGGTLGSTVGRPTDGDRVVLDVRCVE
jgi:hypothetical protein